MSGAQPKAAVIAGVVGVFAEINPKAIAVRQTQKWVDEVYTSFDELIPRIRKASANREVVSLAYQGNIVDLWERLVEEDIQVDFGQRSNLVAQSVCRWLLPGWLKLRGVEPYDGR